MNRKKVLVHASRALCAMVVFASVFAGCEKKTESAKEAETPAERPHYMHDPEFRKQLAVQDNKRTAILGEREKLRREFAALEKRAGSKEAAAKLPEHAALTARAEALGRSFESNRWQTTKLLRARMKLEQEARAARGETRKQK